MLSSFDVRGRPVVVERLLLEEAPHAGAGGEELAVADPLLFAGREDRALATRLEVVDDLVGRSLQLVARRLSTKPSITRNPSRWYCSI